MSKAQDSPTGQNSILGGGNWGVFCTDDFLDMHTKHEERLGPRRVDVDGHDEHHM
jgi:hypothetical protein